MLDELRDAVRDGESRVFVVRGDAGVGKSALLQHLVATASGFRVLQATGVESEIELPFAASHQLCGSILDGLDTLPDPQRDAAGTAFGLRTGSAPDRLLIGLAVLNLLSAASESAPLLCIVDDAQWLDRESAQTLAFVARRLLADHVGLVFATRHPLADFAAFPELVVHGLHDGDAHTLLSAMLRVPLDERVRDRIVAETRGNPLALIEWPRSLTPAELAGGFGTPTLPMTSQIEENFRRQLAVLPQPAQRFLTVAAAEPTGDPTVVWRAARALGLDGGDAIPAIDAGLIEIEVQVRFRHPLVRSAAYNVATLADRQEVHRALAGATDSDRDPDRCAWHRALGTPEPDEAIAQSLEESADRARARGGLAGAAALLERSVALTVDPARRAPRILAAADAHLEAGSFEAAAQLLAAAEAIHLDEFAQAQVALLRARHAIFGGQIRQAPELLLRAARLLEAIDLGSAELAYVQAMAVAQIVGNLTRSVGLREAAEAALACAVPSEITSKQWLRIGIAQFSIEGLAVAAQMLRQASSPIDEPTAAAIHWHTYQLGATNIMWDADAHLRLAELQVAEARQLGALTMMPIGLNSIAHVRLFEGDLDAADSALTEAAQIIDATESGLPFTTEIAVLAALRGNDDAIQTIDHQIGHAREAGLEAGVAAALWASVMFHNGAGQYQKALSVANEAIDAAWPHGEHLYWPELVEAAVRCGQTAIAEQTVTRLRASTEPTDSDWGIGVLRRSEALLAGGSAADELYNEAIERLRRTSIRGELARTYLLYGEWLRRENRRTDARAQLRAAHEMFTAMGFQGFGERARHELLATGETVRKRTADVFDELTPQEAHIARLAAGGDTNPEIGAQLFI
ncbi:MAG: transcriptional regulator, luxR family, partial [bacterium]|nr:transcriptional regulator, luxR family [bacterium]